MPTTDKQGNWIDPRGRAVPKNYVKPLDQKRDRTVEKICKDALNLEAKMIEMKKDFINRVNKYIKEVEKTNKVKRQGKGNVQLTNFSSDRQVEFSMNDVIEFDEKLQLAKSLIDDCIKRWSEGANQNLQVVIDQAFDVDKKGRLNTQGILDLRKLKIKDKNWNRAMLLIGESVRVTGTRQYLVVRTRNSSTDKFKTVNLNFSSI
jgi:hypothetical protein